ncbi:MAG: acyl carrier protein [Lachnospiraceae bacterium]|nr:acyl carrier protein [Lachnospiraceae bacterium]
MEQLINIMSEIRPDIDFETADKLIDDDILDSFDIISIVSEVNDQFGIEINVNDLLPENFNTASALYELIERMMNE